MKLGNSLPSSSHTDIPAELYKHELVLIDSNGKRYTALQGTFKIIDSIVD
jgi:hypothetical protein